MYDNRDIFEVRQYEKPRTHVGFIHWDEKMSKTFLQDGRNLDRLYERVSSFLLETYGPQNLNPRKIMISGFKAAGKNAAEYGFSIGQRNMFRKAMRGIQYYIICRLECMDQSHSIHMRHMAAATVQDLTSIRIAPCCAKSQFCGSSKPQFSARFAVAIINFWRI